jgi:nucleoside-diphosphate-sugar epimerase
MCLPKGLVNVIGCTGELVDLVWPRRRNARVCVETALQSGRVQFFSNAKAQAELGWAPTTSIERSVREAVSWFRNETDVVEALPASSSVESHVR